MTSLAVGLGLGGAGYALQQPGVAASGTVVGALGIYTERLQARSLRRRRRAERLRARHEVTELRRTIAQLRVDVDAFQRALLDTEAALFAYGLPLLPEVEPHAAASVPGDPAPPEPAPAVPGRPDRADRADRADGLDRAPAVVVTAPPEAHAVHTVHTVHTQDEPQRWVQTRAPQPPRPATPEPAGRVNPFLRADTWARLAASTDPDTAGPHAAETKDTQVHREAARVQVHESGAGSDIQASVPDDDPHDAREVAVAVGRHRQGLNVA